MSETKRFSVINEQAVPAYVATLANNWTLKNPFSTIPLATNAESWGRVGSEIVDPMLKLKFTFNIPWFLNVAVNTWGTMHLSVALVSSNDAYNNPSFVNYDFAPSTDPVWFLQNAVGRTTFNGNNVNVLKIWHRRITPDELIQVSPTAGSTTQVYGQTAVVGKLYYKWKGKKTFEDVAAVNAPNFPSGTQLKNNNYYVMVGWQASGGIAPGNRISCLMDTFMYFKDP